MSNECSICLEEIIKSYEKTLQCKHAFHIDCISQWLSNENSCPFCERKFMKEKNLIDFILDLLIICLIL